MAVTIDGSLERFAEWLEAVCQVKDFNNYGNLVVDRSRVGRTFVYISFPELLSAVRTTMTFTSDDPKKFFEAERR